MTACGGAPPWMPLSAATPDRDDPDDGLTLVWIGHGACERLERGAWVRCPTLDYAFTVEQRRRGARWESVKTLRRHHPAYDGSAGPRIQTYFFVVDYAAPDADGRVAARVRSSLGDGTGATDREFRAATLALRAPVSRFAPFDRYRITQAYRYEEGRLEELVELDDGDRPWVRNREVARLFGARTFDAPPTRR
ncbi:MAG: hypothetical protein HS111_03580 [Kofleriaceae bacterium]|nr:hypothetical protein [Kofleriaceae bacterium]MCL4228077.1 hypothetical protein [Myxococcales bacterium]